MRRTAAVALGLILVATIDVWQSPAADADTGKRTSGFFLTGPDWIDAKGSLRQDKLNRLKVPGAGPGKVGEPDRSPTKNQAQAEALAVRQKADYGRPSEKFATGKATGKALLDDSIGPQECWGRVPTTPVS